MGNRFREKVVEEGLEGEVPVVENDEQQAAQGAQAGAEPAAQERGKESKLAKVLGGDILADKLVLRQIPLLLLCLVFLLLIVANRYKVESLLRDKKETEERITFLREERIQLQKQYQKSVKISQIAEDLTERGVGITSGPPYEIEK